MGVEIPDTPYALFVRGGLDDALHRPDDGSRVEVIGGEVIVSPAPKNSHRWIVQQISNLFAQAQVLKPGFIWGVDQGPNLDLVGIEEGYIPDLIVAEQELLDGEGQTGNLCLVTDQVEMAVEVTSRSTGGNDRPPSDGRATKWTGFARTEIPYYLLVDCDPKVAKVFLYSIPDGKAGVYLDKQEWKFGEDVVLPEPFDLVLSTERWTTWG
ncbi:Uma2 family endonuclease [Actinocorallia longicatena]